MIGRASFSDQVRFMERRRKLKDEPILTVASRANILRSIAEHARGESYVLVPYVHDDDSILFAGENP